MKRGVTLVAGAVTAAAAVVLAATTAAGAQAATSTFTTAKVTSAKTSTKTPPVTITWVTTTGDQSKLLAAQPSVTFGADRTSGNTIVVDDTATAQTVRGVGAAMTESSAHLIAALPQTARDQVLRDLFATTGAGVSVVRVPIGASDFALSDYTADDVPAGTTDPDLARFDASRDVSGPGALLAEAAQLQPHLAVMATPWSAPAWMKTSGTTHGGELTPADEAVYARYLVRATKALTDAGVPVVALSPVNEPELSTPAYPSMAMSADQQARLVGTQLRPALDAAGLPGVRVLGFDHNWDDTAYPSQLLTSSAGSAFGGIAFHCYAGDVAAQSQLTGLAPGQEVWTSECSGGSWAPDFGANLEWGAGHMLIGAFRNSSVASLWWNLALDPTGGPTNGGCATCRGVVTIDPANGAVTRNVEWYLLAHVGRYVTPGAVVIGSTATTTGGVSSVAFRNPDGSHVLVALAPAGASQTVNLRWAGHSTRITLPGGSLSTLRW